MHPQTTIAVEACEEQALLKGDAAIDARVRTVFRLLPAPGRAAFVHGEAAWLAYRRATCNAAASRYAGGTIEPVEFASCEVRVNATHLAELGTLERSLR
jgi:uncharacterized protein YecT (DUF1311 family)